MAFQGEGGGKRQDLENVKLRGITGLVSVEACSPGGHPMPPTDGSVEGVFQNPASFFMPEKSLPHSHCVPQIIGTYLIPLPQNARLDHWTVAREIFGNGRTKNFFLI